MKQVIVFPRGQLTDRDKRSLQKAGVCVVEADDPQKVVCVLPGVPLLGADDLLRAALHALATGRTPSDANAAFVSRLNKLVEVTHAAE